MTGTVVKEYRCQWPERCERRGKTYVKRGQMDFVVLCGAHREAFNALPWPEHERWMERANYRTRRGRRALDR